MKDENTPVQEPVKETVKAPKEEVAPVVETPVETSTEDRSAFNCPTCNGEGLVGEVGVETRCPNCGGTGKV